MTKLPRKAGSVNADDMTLSKGEYVLSAADVERLGGREKIHVFLRNLRDQVSGNGNPETEANGNGVTGE